MNNLSLRNIFKRGSLIAYAKIFIPPILFLIGMAVLSSVKGVSFDKFSRDPLQILEAKPYIGVISNIGIIFWTATSAILFYSLKISYRQGRSGQQLYFLFWSGLLTTMMLFDDLLMLHDVIFPGYLSLDERVFYFFYCFSVVALVYFYRKIILRSDYVLFILAFGFLGGAVISDVLLTLGLKLTNEYLVEDGMKFLGIISWFAYFTRTSYGLIEPADKLNG
jgi:hypothetical protein